MSLFCIKNAKKVRENEQIVGETVKWRKESVQWKCHQWLQPVVANTCGVIKKGKKGYVCLELRLWRKL